MKNLDFTKFSNDKEFLYSVITLTIIISILLLFFTWITTIVTLNNNNCTKYKKKFDNLHVLYPERKINFSTCTSAPRSDYCNETSSSLRNYYIKTAYNCCNADGFKNNWVHLCAMEYALKLGARCLDFEIYSINNEPVIASSTSNNITFKETFNYLTLAEVLKALLQGFPKDESYHAFSSNNDPLILHFRIKTQQRLALKNMGLLLQQVFSVSDPTSLFQDHSLKRTRLRGSRSGYDGIDKQLIKNIQNKIIIMVDSTSNSTIKSIPELHDYVNLYSGTDYKILRISQIDSKNEMLIGESKTRMHIVLPDLNNKLNNYDFYNAFINGCQLIAMKFQSDDPNLRGYLQMFRDKEGKSFSLKHHSLREDIQTFDTSGYVENNPLQQYGLGQNANKTLVIKYTDTGVEYGPSLSTGANTSLTGGYPSISVRVQSYTDDIIINRNSYTGTASDLNNDNPGIRNIRVSGQNHYYITITPLNSTGWTDESLRQANNGNAVTNLALDYNHILANVQGATIIRHPEATPSPYKFKITPTQGASRITIDIALAR